MFLNLGGIVFAPGPPGARYAIYKSSKKLLNEFKSANITTEIPRGTASGDWAQLYSDAGSGWIYPAEYEDVYAVGSPKWINIR